MHLPAREADVVWGLAVLDLREALVSDVTVVYGSTRHAAHPPFLGAPWVDLADTTCPACSAPAPRAKGSGGVTHDHDTYYAPGALLCCGAPVTIEVTVETLFGIEEDEAVLVHGRARVYGGSRRT